MLSSGLEAITSGYGQPKIRRRKVQQLDHLTDLEMNEVVNRMFGNMDQDVATYLPWEQVWQCSSKVSSVKAGSRPNTGSGSRPSSSHSSSMHSSSNASRGVLQPSTNNWNNQITDPINGSRDDHFSSQSQKARLGSVYGSQFQSSEVLLAARTAGSARKFGRDNEM